MKKILLLLLLLSLPAICYSSSERPQERPHGVTVGSVAPDFTLENMQGEKVSLLELRGKVVIVNFWATWCPPCREEMPSMEELYKTFKDDDLVMLALNVEDNGHKLVTKFLKKYPYSFPILLDSQRQVQNLYRVYQYPQSYIVDRSGIVVKKIIGGVHWMSGDIYNLLNFMLKG